MNISFNGLLLFFLVFFSIQNASACEQITFQPTNMTQRLGDVVIQRDAAVGSVLYTYSITTGNEFLQEIAHCTASDVGRYTLVGATKVSGYTDVYSTGVPGVGIKIMAGGSYVFSNPPIEVSYAGYWQWSYWGQSFDISLIKTATTTGSGDIGAFKADMSLTGINPDPMILNLTGGTVTTVACSIKTPNINILLGDVSASEFISAGSTPKSVDFHVGLECDAGANINVSMSGTQSSESNDSSILALTGAGGADVANGVGVQIVYDGAPLKLNDNIKLKTSAGGQELLPFTARYYQTKSEVKTGSANATATLNITYQ
ncbi:fimbrial protein [Scandinavium goeteborgense]|uniref:fimbrial protein n=1 Tax=Scandinavium goeteborgense TaxID=1851514 RepID=UPI00380F3639